MIVGRFDENRVYIDGVPLSTRQSRKVVDHAPDGGVSWGYLGSGPSQLSLALLLYFGASEEEARDWYQQFKTEALAPLPRTDFEMDTKLVEEWIEVRRLFADELEGGSK